MIFRSCYCLLSLFSNKKNQKWNIQALWRTVDKEHNHQWKTRLNWKTIISEEPGWTWKVYCWWEKLTEMSVRIRVFNFECTSSQLKYKNRRRTSTIRWTTCWCIIHPTVLLLTARGRVDVANKLWKRKKTKLKTEALTPFSVQDHTKLWYRLRISTLTLWQGLFRIRSQMNEMNDQKIWYCN